MNKSACWFAYVIKASEPDAYLYLHRAGEAGAEIYCHGGDFPHWHVLVHYERPVWIETARRKLGRFGDDSFCVPRDPDATRRYMRNGGVKV